MSMVKFSGLCEPQFENIKIKLVVESPKLMLMNLFYFFSVRGILSVWNGYSFFKDS